MLLLWTGYSGVEATLLFSLYQFQVCMSVSVVRNERSLCFCRFIDCVICEVIIAPFFIFQNKDTNCTFRVIYILRISATTVFIFANKNYCNSNKLFCYFTLVLLWLCVSRLLSYHKVYSMSVFCMHKMLMMQDGCTTIIQNPSFFDFNFHLQWDKLTFISLFTHYWIRLPKCQVIFTQNIR